MSRARKAASKAKIHTNMLQKSSVDLIELVNAVQERFLVLCEAWMKQKFEELEVPSYLDADMLLWRSVAVRHKSGDWRHTEDEKKATRRIADWTLEKNCILRNQKYTPIEWSD